MAQDFERGTAVDAAESFRLTVRQTVGSNSDLPAPEPHHLPHGSADQGGGDQVATLERPFDTPAPARPARSDTRLERGIKAALRSSLSPAEIVGNFKPIYITIAALAAAGAILAQPAPTGGPLVDAILTTIFVAAIVAAAPFARRDALVCMAAISMVFVGIQFWLIAAAAGFGLALAMVYYVRLHPIHFYAGAALSAALSVQGIIRFSNIGFLGSASLLAVAAVAPVFISSMRHLDARIRHKAVIATLITIALAVLCTGAAALSVFYGRASAEAGVQRANDGLRAATGADQEEAIKLLGYANGHFGAAANNFGVWWAKPGRLVPIVAQHARAIETGAVQGQALTEAATRALTSADINQVRADGGRLNLAVLQDVGVELNRTTLTLGNAISELQDVRSPWLIPLISRTLDDATTDLSEAAVGIGLAAEAAAVVPGMLGADGPRTYLVIFMNPAEAREAGGFGGAFGVLSAVDGKLELIRSGRTDQLNEQATEQGVADRESYPTAYMNYKIEKFFGNLTGTPDFPTVARAAAEIFPQMGGETVDGVVALDPYALSALLELSGPVKIDAFPEAFGPDNVADFLLREQYTLDLNVFQRENFLGAIAGEAFAALVNADIPNPSTLGDLFGTVARQKRIKMHTFDAAENAFLDQLFLGGAFPDVGFDSDFIAVLHDDAAPTKLDAYFDRDLVYDLEFDPATRELDGTLTITMTNSAPDDLPSYVQGEEGFYYDLEPGTHRVRLSVYSNKNVESIERDGVGVRVERYVEYDTARTLTFLDVPRGESVTVVANITGEVQGSGGLDVYFASQPTVNFDTVTVRIRPSQGWEVAGTGESEFTTDFTLREDTIVSVDFAAAANPE